ncbi:MAG: BglG family transcription antiterminator LicT [Mycoplasmatales bacterium]
MKIHKILNNNFVIIITTSGDEQIIGGKGIAFGKRVGDLVDLKIINKTFVIPSSKNNDITQRYVSAIPIEYFEVAINILKMAKIKIEKTINESVCLSIADHIYACIQRYECNIHIPNYMLWELKKFYIAEYEVGKYGLSLIEREFGISLMDDEAGFIAAHIIDSELKNSNIEQVYKTATLIKDISNIVKYFFNINFDNDSIYYYRFVTHLKFFAGRLFNEYMFNESSDDRLYKMIKKSYVNSFNCTLKIQAYLELNYVYKLSKEEKVYLTIHIENVIYKVKK